MACTNRFMYSDDDRARIHSSVPKLLPEQENELFMEWDDLLELHKKHIRMSLHVSTLSQYCEKSQIPRGLRIQKRPTLFSEEFRQKWTAIINKCSYDLMLLIIEESMSEYDKISKSINEAEDKLKSSI